MEAERPKSTHSSIEFPPPLGYLVFLQHYTCCCLPLLRLLRLPPVTKSIGFCVCRMFQTESVHVRSYKYIQLTENLNHTGNLKELNWFV